MMAEWLGETSVARIIEHAVADVIGHGSPRTYDMGGTAGTHEIARAVAQHIDNQGARIEEVAGCAQRCV